MNTKLWPTAVLALGLIVLGACIALIVDHRPQPYNGPVTEVTMQNFEQEVLKSKLPVYVEFYVDTSKCEACAKQEPVLDKMANEYKGRVHFVRINAMKNQDLAAGAGIKAVPTHFFFRTPDDAPIGARGFLDEEKIKLFIETGLKGPAAAQPSNGAPSGQPATPPTDGQGEHN